jgi:hypothetical protein
VVVALNDIDWRFKCALDCQLAPQFLDIDIQPVFDPFMDIDLIEPLPPTLVIRTSSKYSRPLIVNRTPPRFKHGTLHDEQYKNMFSQNIQLPDLARTN